MATFYFNGTGAQGNRTGGSAADASGDPSAAITALAGGDSVEVTAGTLTLTAAQASGGTITGAGSVSISDPVTVAQANRLLDSSISATLSLSSITDTAAQLATSNDTLLALASTVTASDAATASQANTIAAFAAPVVYSISDTAANLAGATAAALNEAVNLKSRWLAPLICLCRRCPEPSVSHSLSLELFSV